MSQLDDIVYMLYETAGQSPGKYIRSEWSGLKLLPDQAKQQVKDLMLELIGNIPEDWENYNGEMYGIFNERKRMAQEVSDL